MGGPSRVTDTLGMTPTQPRRSGNARRSLLPLLVFLGVAALGVALAILGSFLGIRLCLGGGSECRNVEPIWAGGGHVLQVVGNALLLASPIPAVIVAWRSNRHSSPGGSLAWRRR